MGPDRGVAFGATTQTDDALRGAHARVPRAARGAVRRADELPGERAAAAEDPRSRASAFLGSTSNGQIGPLPCAKATSATPKAYARGRHLTQCRKVNQAVTNALPGKAGLLPVKVSYRPLHYGDKQTALSLKRTHEGRYFIRFSLASKAIGPALYPVCPEWMKNPRRTSEITKKTASLITATGRSFTTLFEMPASWHVSTTLVTSL